MVCVLYKKGSVRCVPYGLLVQTVRSIASKEWIASSLAAGFRIGAA